MREKVLDNFILDDSTMPALMNLADGMPGGFFVYQARGEEKILYCNRSLMRIFGCETGQEFMELTGNTFRGIVHPEDYERVEKSIWYQIENSKNDLDFVEYRIVRRDGEVRWVEDYGHYRNTEAYGEVFYVFIQDHTERIQERVELLEKINSELRASNIRESQFKKAILYDAIAFFEINFTKDEFIYSKGNEEEVASVNPFDYMGMPHFKTFTEYVEYLVERAEGEEKEAYKTFFDTKRLLHCFEIGELEQTHESWTLDYFGRKRLHKYIVLLGKDENTGDLIALFMAKDVTDQLERQRLIEMALVQANAASIARQTFLSSMSHDIRTPLNSIIGFAELIKSHAQEADKVQDYAEKIRNSGSQLLSIVSESLEITRMESGKVELEIGEGNVVDILDEIAVRFTPEFEKKNMTFVLRKEGISHPAVMLDIMRFREILCQLVDNAIKYTNEGGRIEFTAQEIPSNHTQHVEFAFSVRDNGIGISEEFQTKIFDNFERAHNTTLSGVLGSGLGLAVVKNIVDMMKGTIEVESREGEGSCFTVHVTFALPRKKAEKAEKPVSVDSVELKGRKILLVEDNEINMEIARELLEMVDFEVDIAENGRIAVHKVESQPAGSYDVILMDIQMPVMDGYQATKAIRDLADKEKANIPIIAVSANAFAEDVERSLAAGMNAHCAKPIDIRKLQEQIAKQLAR